MAFDDKTGRRFGRLTAVEYVGGSKWRCVCDCGNSVVTKSRYLNSGEAKSCGCLVADSAMARTRDLTGMRFGSLTVLSREGYMRSLPAWRCRCDCGNELVVTGKDLRRQHVVRCSDCRNSSHKYDLTGRTFGRLRVVRYAGARMGGPGKWECQCECGNTTLAGSKELIDGKKQSCGCYRKDKHLRHGKYGSRLYRIWKGMRARCYNTNSPSYHLYGGRGITVCPEWDDYENFYQWATQNGYNPDLPSSECTIDRIDPDGNYEPNNCRWVDTVTQSLNRRPYRTGVQNRPVALIDDSGVAIRIFRNSKVASQEMMCSYTQIRNVLKGRTETIKGMKFRFVDELSSDALQNVASE